MTRWSSWAWHIDAQMPTREATACLTEALAESRAMNDERHAADTLYHLGRSRGAPG